ncbi:hypothetical protein EVAR_50593_1 [Eumeta japonica]|uniref:Uncharacterized protein n=1 Tax=Eumeta variegata TaxID=151549 RepID=A0A4C1Y891_EUMVA|nr:hypothetical protein EVAR_50593_1 [Eumeta japonica]
MSSHLKAFTSRFSAGAPVREQWTRPREIIDTSLYVLAAIVIAFGKQKPGVPVVLRCTLTMSDFSEFDDGAGLPSGSVVLLWSASAYQPAPSTDPGNRSRLKCIPRQEKANISEIFKETLMSRLQKASKGASWFRPPMIRPLPCGTYGTVRAADRCTGAGDLHGTRLIK